VAEPCDSIPSAMWVDLALCEMYLTDQVVQDSLRIGNIRASATAAYQRSGSNDPEMRQ
jgi:hypothetical protein